MSVSSSDAGAGVGFGPPSATSLDVPVIEEFAVSVAVNVWAPPVRKVAENVPVPLVKVPLPGSDAETSLLVK